MATQAIDQVPEAEGAVAAPSAGAKKSIMIMAIAGVLAGAGAGFFVAGPVLAAKKPAAAPAAKDKKGEHTEAAVSHSVENLVLNPAGTNGSRFLMVTANFQLKDGGVEQLMKDHDAEVRDRILGVLGKKTVDELSDISQRDAIKKEVLDGVAPLFPAGSIVKLFFAQFVIQ